MISPFSVLNALLTYTIMLFAVCKLSERIEFFEKGGEPVLWFVCVVAVTRMILPIELPLTHAVRLWSILGLPQRLLYAFPIIAYALLTVWGIGLGKYLWRDARKLYDAYRKCDNYTAWESEHVQEIADRCKVKCRVLVSPDVEAPYVVGIVRHTIYLPYPELDDLDTEMALRHEAQHIRGCHALFRLLFGLLSEAVWWSRLSEKFQSAVDRILEFRCDRKVMKRMTEDERTAYLEMLARVADRVVTKREALALGMNEFCVLGDSQIEILQRFRVIEAARKGKQRWYIRYGAKFLVLVLFFASYLVMFQAASKPSTESFEEKAGVLYHDYDGLEIEDVNIQSNISDAFIFKGDDGRYALFVNYTFSGYLTESEVTSDKYRNLFVFEEEAQK